MIIVTGATGALNCATVAHLLALFPAPGGAGPGRIHVFYPRGWGRPGGRRGQPGVARARADGPVPGPAPAGETGAGRSLRAGRPGFGALAALTAGDAVTFGEIAR